jgi:ferritin-like metal-binding protein YciE
MSPSPVFPGTDRLLRWRFRKEPENALGGTGIAFTKGKAIAKNWTFSDGERTMELDTLKDLYIDELKDLYSAEKQLTKALPKMAKAAKHKQLQAAFRTHLKETEQHIERLERICKDLGVSPRGKKCVGMEGLIEEGNELIKEKPDEDVLDAGLISKAQHVEHYEMAGYGTVRTYARQLGFEEQADLLQQTLDEEGRTDHLLTELAESGINVEAEA